MQQLGMCKTTYFQNQLVIQATEKSCMIKLVSVSPDPYDQTHKDNMVPYYIVPNNNIQQF